MKINKGIKILIAFLTLIFTLIIIYINLRYYTTIRSAMSENIIFENSSLYNSILSIFITVLFGIFLYIINKMSSKIKINKKVKKLILILAILIYGILQVVWINIRDANPNYDQFYVFDNAVKMSKGEEELIDKEYLEMYPQQISLVSFYSIILKIFNTENVKILQYLNVLANIFTVLWLYSVTKIIQNKENRANYIALFAITLTFSALIFLSTFIYGDIISLPFAIYSIYFVIKYIKENRCRYLLVSAILMCISYFLRMNMLIFFIAILIYLLLEFTKFINNLVKDKSLTKKLKIKNISMKAALIVVFCIISILPTNLFKIYMQEKLNLNKENSFPLIGFIDLGLADSTRGPGWYTDPYVDKWRVDGHDTKPMKERINNKIEVFKEDPKILFEFYFFKIASMWGENSFGSIWYNLSFNFGNMSVNKGTASEQEIENYEKFDNIINKNYSFIMVYDKIIILLIFISVLLFILRNKDISNEQILLILIFVGGFLFHIIWEAKSRYILPYVIILIPIMAIGIDGNIKWIKEIINGNIKYIKGKIHK